MKRINYPYLPVYCKGFFVLVLLCLLIFSCKKESVQKNQHKTPINTAQTPQKQQAEELLRMQRKSGSYYEIFVRSFADSNNDGIGDIQGLIGSLDYLNDGNPDSDSDLSIDGIWLMPLSPSPSYHKYDVVDYYGIDPEYGSLADFRRLLAAAHLRGIKVIIDLVINHTSSQHPWFRAALEDPKSKYRNYYHFADSSDPRVYGDAWRKLDSDLYYYALFSKSMPDLNYDEPELRQEIQNIAKFWLELGVDGFRLDAAKHIYSPQEDSGSDLELENKNLAWWLEFRSFCQSINPDVYLVGEVWAPEVNVAKYYQVFDSNFHFELGVVDLVLQGKDGRSGKAARWEKIYGLYANESPFFIDAPFLSNHDQKRSMSDLLDEGNPVEATMPTEMAKLSASIYLSLAGNPFIYYGEEIGMKGQKPDENIREPFLWGNDSSKQTKWLANTYNQDSISESEQQNDPNSLLNHYKSWLRLRKQYPALAYGSFSAYRGETQREILSYTRKFEQEEILVLHNLSSQTIDFDVNLDGAERLYSTSPNPYQSGQLQMQKYSSSLFRLP